MKAEECKWRALALAGVRPEQKELAQLSIDAWMAPYEERDATVDPGVVLVDEIDPETGRHRTVERQLHPARLVRPFVFGPSEVRDLVNHIRRELRLK
jgi:hypothetical protein